jgi:methionyl aminopeptidase
MVLKTKAELEGMRQAGKVVAALLRLMEQEVRPGVTTQQLDAVAEKFIRSQGATPAFKGYHGFPASICASVNEEVVHGIPGQKILQEGDIVGIDVGAIVDGYYADAARTFPVGKVDPESQKLIEVTREAMKQGIAKAVEGNRISDISHAVQQYAEKHGYGVVRKYTGHGIGKNLHEEPQVPNFGKPNQGMKLVEGMALAIEPMLNAGSYEVDELSDGWTVVTRDRKRSAHFEQSIVVGKKKPEILTE